MDLTAFTGDIDELIESFVEIGGQELSEMKELWRSRSFSFIHDARPRHVHPGFFMQALYSCALDCMGRTFVWSKKLGGLYVLYILYETQLSAPPYKIYLSTVSISGKKLRESYLALSNRASDKVKKARDRILGRSAKGHFEGNLAKDLGLDALLLLNEEYAMSKQRVLKGKEDDSNNLGPLTGEEIMDEVKLWMEKRKRFFGTEEQEGLFHEESSSAKNLFEKTLAAASSSDREGDETADFMTERDGDCAMDPNGSVGEDIEFERELENALDWD